MINEAEYDCCPDKIYQDVTFRVKLYRYRWYMMVTIIFPCGLTAILAIMTFFVPPDAGEKIGLSKSMLI